MYCDIYDAPLQFETFISNSRAAVMHSSRPTFGEFRSGFRDANGWYEYFRMDFRAPFPVGSGVDHIVVDVPFEPGRHGSNIGMRVTMFLGRCVLYLCVYDIITISY